MAERKTEATRRDFLKLAGVSAPGAVSALAMSAGAAGAADAEEMSSGTGLRSTEHVLKYLETARY